MASSGGRNRRYPLYGILGAAFLRVLGGTLRVSRSGEEGLLGCRARGQPVLFAFWHRWILPLAYLHRDEGICVLVSQHGDGEIITQVIHRMGFTTARGSSTRGGARGLRKLVQAGRRGLDLGVTPDGPRGPAETVKPGALLAAQLSGAAIVPIVVEGCDAWAVGSWDRMAIPKPFGRLQVRYGDPIEIPRELPGEELNQVALQLEHVLSGKPA